MINDTAASWIYVLAHIHIYNGVQNMIALHAAYKYKAGVSTHAMTRIQILLL